MGRKQVRKEGEPGQAMLSAQVILRAASGRPVLGAPPIHGGNLASFAARAADVQAAQHDFQALGFEVGAYVGISFAITAAAARFEQVFDVQVHADARGGIEVRRGTTSYGYEVPHDKLGAALAARIETVTFSPPAELFGGAAMA